MSEISTSFGYSSCADVQAKMRRELGRLQASNELNDMKDHAINFCIAAWHMRDWVWRVVCRNSNFKLLLAKDCEVSPQEVNLDTFTKWLLSKLDTNSYLICQIIATDIKHTASNRFEYDYIEVYSSARTLAPDKGQIPDPFDISLFVMTDKVFSSQSSLRLKIKIDEDKFGAIETFTNVANFWDHFVETYLPKQ